MIKDWRFRPKTTLDNCILSLCYSSSVSVLLVWTGLTVLISQVPLLLPSPNKGKVPPWKQPANNLTVSGACAQACLAPLSSSSHPFRLLSLLGVFSYPLDCSIPSLSNLDIFPLGSALFRLWFFYLGLLWVQDDLGDLTRSQMPLGDSPPESPWSERLTWALWSQCPAGSKFTEHTRMSELPDVCILLGHPST